MSISFDDFRKVDIRVGTIVDVQEFPEARKPALKLSVDFGGELGTRKTSARSLPPDIVAGLDELGIRDATLSDVRRRVTAL